jgi:hypothetical protein
MIPNGGKRVKKRLSIIFRDPTEVPHRKGKKCYSSKKYIGVNSIIVDSESMGQQKLIKFRCFGWG